MCLTDAQARDLASLAAWSYAPPVCMQFMMGAITAAAGVTGTGAWLSAKGYSWMTPRRTRIAALTLIVAGLIGSAVLGA